MAFPVPPKSIGLRPLFSSEWQHKTEPTKVKIIGTCFKSVGLKSYIGGPVSDLCQPTCLHIKFAATLIIRSGRWGSTFLAACAFQSEPWGIKAPFECAEVRSLQ